MVRAYVVVEGQTEESFVAKVLAPVLWPRGVYLYPLLVGKPGHKGGVISYQRAKGDVLRLLKQDRGAYCTTMFDFFRLPSDFPGIPLQNCCSTQDKARRIEDAFLGDVASALGDRLDPGRFLPYIQMHEFEGLLFSDSSTFASGILRPHLEQAFMGVRASFGTPEDINDGPTTAPSKRVLALCPDFSKPAHGVLAAAAIGIDTMRGECPHFHHWVASLEALQ